MGKLLNERTGRLIAGQCKKEKAFGAVSEGLFCSLRAAGLEVYQRIRSFQNAQGFTLKQPHDNVRNYSHSIVAIVLCVLPCAISCHLVRLFSSSPNHFVIRWVITNHRIPDSNADFCDDSLAIIPDFVNGNSIGWFAVRRFGQNRHSYSSGDSLEVVYVPIRKLILGAGISSKKCQGQPRLLEALLL